MGTNLIKLAHITIPKMESALQILHPDDAVTGHYNPEMAVLGLLVGASQLEDNIYIIDFLHFDRFHTPVFIKSIDRDFGIVHLLGKAHQVEPHYLIDAVQGIFIPFVQLPRRDSDPFAVEHNLLFEYASSIVDGGREIAHRKHLFGSLVV